LWVFGHCTRTVSESLHEGTVRLQNILILEPFRTHPFEALPVEALRFPVKARDNPHGKLHVPIVVRMLEPHERATRRNINTELLPELAREGIGLGLTGADFATRKFPTPSHVLTRRALRDQNTAVAVIQRGGYDEQCRSHAPALTPRSSQGAVAVLELLS
jgi:hypothetical protein